MRLRRNWIGLTLAVALAAGCQTAKVKNVAVTEVALPEPKPFAMSAPLVELPVPAATNAPPVAPPPPAPTNAMAPLQLAPPVGGWVPLENWCFANGLGKPQNIGAGQYAVATRTGVLVVHLGSQVARWDGTQVWLGFPPRLLSRQPHLHWLDVQKTLEPLLHRDASLPRTGRVVVIDPGHGGSDGGTQGSVKQQVEKNYTLDWALRVQALLLTNGWQVILTRSTDAEVSLTNRVAIAERANADLFVSLHFNGLSGVASHSGVETFCLTPLGQPSTVKRGFEDNLGAEFPNNRFDRENLQWAFRFHRAVLAATRAADGGVKRARFMTVLRGQHRPAVLIEGGFLSNPEEGRRIATAAYRQKLAEAVARALEER